MPIDPRYTPLGGSSRRYLDTETGNTVSRYQASIKPEIERIGWDNAHQRAHYRSTVEYKRLELVAGQNGLSKREHELRYAAALREGRMIENMDRISKGLKPSSKLRMHKGYDGLFATYLVDLGLRDRAESYAVGETPPKKR